MYGAGEGGESEAPWEIIEVGIEEPITGPAANTKDDNWYEEEEGWKGIIQLFIKLTYTRKRKFA